MRLNDLYGEHESLPALERLRAGQPVTPIEMHHGTTGWLVTGYDDVRRLLADPRLVKDGRMTPTGVAVAAYEPDYEATDRHMLTTDPPDHTRLRRLVTGAFTARRVERLRADVVRVTDQLLDTLGAPGEHDFVAEFALPLPFQVICDLLGVPEVDRTEFRRWTGMLTAVNVRRRDALPARAELLAYTRDLIDLKRARPADDLLSALVMAGDEGDRLTRDELTSTVILLMVAGHDTTVNMLSSGAFRLLADRAQWDKLVADPALVPGAVEEMVRYDSPVQSATHRRASVELEVGGVTIPAGATVILSILSANHDAPFADGFDVGNDARGHVAFGHGIHYCLGAPLARLEGQVAFERLLARLPGLRLADGYEPRWSPSTLMRGLAELRVQMG
jgi:cytochrome P450